MFCFACCGWGMAASDVDYVRTEDGESFGVWHRHLIITVCLTVSSRPEANKS